MSYPVTVLEEGKKMQIGGWVYTVKELKASWKLSYDMGNMEVVVNVPKATAPCIWLIFSFKKTLKTVDKSAAAVVLSMYKYTCGFAAYAKKLYGGVP